MHNHIASAVVQKVIEVADVDGVVRQIDVNHVVQRIEWNDVVEKIDWNALLLTIDWNQQLERIDLDTVLQRVDTKSIIARSSTGIFTTFLDTLRTQLVMMDLYLIIVTRCRIWHRQHSKRCILPPHPGRRQREDRQEYPKGRTNKAVAVQGRYCGFISKAMALMLDILAVTLLYALLFRFTQWCLVLFLGVAQDQAYQRTKQFQEEKTDWMLFVYCVLWFAYFFLSVTLACQTLGMMIMGLRVCDCNRSNPVVSLSPLQVFVRTCLLPVTITVCPPLGVIGLVRRDGRMVHDLVANLGLIYMWDAKLAKIRQRVMRAENRADSTVTEYDEDGPDELDHIMGHDDDDDGENEENDEVERNDNSRERQGLLQQEPESFYSTFA